MTLGGKVSDRGSVGTDSDGKWREKIHSLSLCTGNRQSVYLGVFQTASQPKRSQRGREKELNEFVRVSRARPFSNIINF